MHSKEEVEARFDELRSELLGIIRAQGTEVEGLKATIRRNAELYKDESDGLKRRLQAAEVDVVSLEKDLNKRTEVSWALFSQNKDLVKRNKALEDKYELAKKIITRDKEKLKRCSCKANERTRKSTTPEEDEHDSKDTTRLRAKDSASADGNVAKCEEIEVQQMKPKKRQRTATAAENETTAELYESRGANLSEIVD